MPLCKKFLTTDAGQWATIPLRIALGVIFMAHGGQKLFGWLGGKGLEGTAGFFIKLGLTPGMLWAVLAGLAEFGGGLLVLLGLFTRFGAASIALVMLVAILKVHWGAFFMPSGIEYAASLFATAIALLIAGGGRFSLDAQLQKN
ncbi:MAG: DoxX family protein [Deltaproteobacteria bacterium]|nr:DoxX family protein [Deltaproteobacteria bacterium]